ncbi:MAG: hypothetical protein H7Z14_00765 [Anaerolineae bacterium]|nr:hypothetical protein [Phycisphaerae bacterium]
MNLFHVSENPNLTRFDPREPTNTDAGITAPAVWAVHEERLRNYLLPRECPRVTFYTAADSDPNDVRALIGATAANAVVAIEAAWLERARMTTLYCYLLPSNGFECIDNNAGYWINRGSVTPVRVERIDDCLTAILERGVELRLVPSLWPLRDAVVNSTLHFSLIRMRNARPRME